MVTAVATNSAADRKGVNIGDIILKIGQKEISAPSDLAKVVDELKDTNRTSALLLIYRNGARRFVALPIE